MSKISRKKLIICILLIVFTAFPAVFINTFFGYFPAIAIILGILCSFCYVQLLKKSLSYEEASALENCERGSNKGFKIHMRNKSLLFFPGISLMFFVSDMFGGNDSLMEAIITLAPRETREFPLDVTFDHIGIYTAGLKYVKIQDPVGLFSYTDDNGKCYQITVIPKIHELSNVPISDTAASQSEKLLTPNPMESTDYMGVREYVIGDHIKNIHWKISARTNTYMTKVFESYTNTGLCTILDFRSPEYDSETLMCIADAVVETGLSVACYASEMGLDSEVKFYDKKMGQVKISSFKKDSLVSVAENIPAVYTERKKTDAMQILQEEGNGLYSQGNIAFCTAMITDELISTLIQIRNRRKNPMLFAVIPDGIDDEKRLQMKKPLKSLDEYNIYYHIVQSADDLDGGTKIR